MLRLPAYSDDAPRAEIRRLGAAPEAQRVGALLEESVTLPGEEVVRRASTLIDAIRDRQRYHAGINALLGEYSLSSREGVVLMCLAEALLRVPDPVTADRLISDKLRGADWRAHIGRSESLFVNASAWALLLTGRLVDLGQEDSPLPWQTLRRAVARAGEPAIRAAMRLAMRIMGTQFVIGTDIDEALAESRPWQARGYRYSYDLLGEGARSDAAALVYLDAYRKAIPRVGRAAMGSGPVERPGFSLKLSALHPRFELPQGARLRRELLPRVLELAELARDHDLGLCIDAEEGERLEPTLELFGELLTSHALASWEGLGIAVQAYRKDAPALIDWLSWKAERHRRRLMVRLVKGAYWDAEIKRAQSLGLDAYPVYTRKASTDLSWLVCARRLLACRDRLYPQFATHNAHSVSSVLTMCGTRRRDFEFQRLHGMGEELYEALEPDDGEKTAVRIYAPVGVHRDLLAYLVRRLLENGANSSFVHALADPALDSARIATDPRSLLRGLRHVENRALPAPRQLYGGTRSAARGLDTGSVSALRAFAASMRVPHPQSAPDQTRDRSDFIEVRNPARRDKVLGHYRAADAGTIEHAIRRATACASSWADTPVAERARSLRGMAEAMEQAMPELSGYCLAEAGKSVRDAVADVREAIDFCRYYAEQAERLGAEHGAALRARGPILCISPWNFPVAIFVGQIAAALSTGNPVIAKPAEQTTLVALRLLSMFHESGVPPDALTALCGPGEPVAARLLPDPRLAGVMFTGSNSVARYIATELAAREGPRAMLIAETGGINAMVVDSSALPEQVVDDVIASGFNSAGQRCSALRLLLVQHEIADSLIELLAGAMDALVIGDPADAATDIGPIIDEQARAGLQEHVAWLEGRARLLHGCTLPEACERGVFFAPRLYEINDISDLRREVFGPVVHVLRYRAEDLALLPERINAAGYGLTFGVHSRIDSNISLLVRGIKAGNVYVNRNMIGAVVGVQPFGGRGLSGTGPKAGGPLYLPRLLAAGRRCVQARCHMATEPGLDSAAPDQSAARSALAALREAQRRRGACALTRNIEAARRLLRHLPAVQAVEMLREEIGSLLAQAQLIDTAIELRGPTGERNTLEFEPRGVLLCLARDGAGARELLLPTLATLLAGNSVLIVCDNASAAQVRDNQALLRECGFESDVCTSCVATNADELFLQIRDLQHDGIVCHNGPQLARIASRALAARDGDLLPLIDDDFGPLYLLRFVHEKTLSVNTAASGGNAALLALSEHDD